MNALVSNLSLKLSPTKNKQTMNEQDEQNEHKPGRPPLPESARRVSLALTVPRETKSRGSKIAFERGISLSQLVEEMIDREVAVLMSDDDLIVSRSDRPEYFVRWGAWSSDRKEAKRMHPALAATVMLKMDGNEEGLKATLANDLNKRSLYQKVADLLEKHGQTPIRLLKPKGPRKP